MTPAGRWVARMRCRPEGAAALGDVDHAVDELGDLLDQRGELVDHDDQARRGGDLAAALELDQVLGLVLGEDVLAVLELGRQRRERPPDQVRRQVGDQADGVRQVDAVAERRAALVVDEQEGEPLRGVGHGHAEDPGLQQLGLAGAGGAADEGVRPVGPQVDREGAGGGLPDDGTQVAGLGAGHRAGGVGTGEDRPVLPPALDDRSGRLGELVADEVDERHRARQVALVLDRHTRVDERGHLAAEPLDRRGLDVVGVDRHPDDRLADVADHGVTLLGALLDEGAAGGGQGRGRRRHPEHDDAVAPAALGQLDQPAALDGGVVLDDEQHDRTAGGQPRWLELALHRAGRVVGAARWTARPLAISSSSSVTQREAGRTGVGQVPGVDRAVRGRRVRHPLQPVPVAGGGRRADRRHDEVGGRVQRDGLDDDGAGRLEGALARARDADRAAAQRLGDDRHGLDGAHAVDRLRRLEPGLGPRAAELGELEGVARRQHAEPEPELAEAGVARAAGPQQGSRRCRPPRPPRSWRGARPADRRPRGPAPPRAARP